jgi:DNA (cytosine-5)-methyltransferase 1
VEEGALLPISFGAQMSQPQTDVDMVQTLQAKNPMAIAQSVALDYEFNAHSVDTATGPLLRGSPSGGGHPLPAVMSAMQVRRLTPVECERLQGFPDNYTNIPWRKKPESPDGPRYKALGNSMAVPVMRWIGERINQVEQI